MLYPSYPSIPQTTWALLVSELSSQTVPPTLLSTTSKRPSTRPSSSRLPFTSLTCKVTEIKIREVYIKPSFNFRYAHALNLSSTRNDQRQKQFKHKKSGKIVLSSWHPNILYVKFHIAKEQLICIKSGFVQFNKFIEDLFSFFLSPPPQKKKVKKW